MNNELTPELDQRFRIHVERIVRPVRAAERRKDRMREELLAHATAAYGEERQVRGNDDEAVMATFNRLGESAELTREFQAGVSWIERMLFRGERTPTRVKRWVMCKPGESIWRCAVRSTAFFGLVFPLAVVGAACLLVPLFNMKPTGFARLTARWPMLLWFYLIMMVFCFLGPPSAEAVHRAIWGPIKRYGLAAWICLFNFLSVLAACFWVRWEALDRVFVIGPDPWLWAGLAVVSPILLIFQSRMDYSDRQRYYRWTSLDLTE